MISDFDEAASERTTAARIAKANGRAKISARIAGATSQDSIAPDLSHAWRSHRPGCRSNPSASYQRGGTFTARLKSGAVKSRGENHPRRAEIFAPPSGYRLFWDGGAA
jgi:hypothetical protein